MDWSSRFPRLFAPTHWAWGNIDAEFSLEFPPDELISNVHVVGRTDSGVVVCRNDLGWRFLPGGTREPGESVTDCLARELGEEAGATLTGPVRWIGAHRAHHRADAPYRAHLPYPVSYWLWAVAPVVLDGVPTNPPDGEQVVEVLSLPPEQAAAWLAVHDELAGDLVLLTEALANP